MAFLVLQLVGLAVVDRVAAHLAASQMVSQVQKSQQLPTKPEASVGGFPFLTQVVAGNYKDIGLQIHRVAASGLCVDDIDLHVRGAHLPLRKLISNDVTTMPIDRVVGTVKLTYADLNAYLAGQPGDVRLAAAKNGMRVSAPVDVPIVGQVKVFGDVRATVLDNRLTIAPTALGVDGLGALSIPAGAVRTLTVDVPLSGLPMDLRLTEARTTSAGVEVTAEADHLNLDTTRTSTTQLRGC
ncbi:DUF2993 domain-containing protein [Frankia sp. AgB1.9]|uniref:LmeA family phospholipid-binding protein n=1 Tax=unclassified Frankia TaxID=2632575 RepID=UPI001933C3CE|nr:MULTISPECIES: DUF2993 domain-containing protein [unclassified Frankia]MBL7492998.1 DUF2993 domain-containing protein [Frankia sp. AgW1.1]MBL7549602.1 DUF2993 domain-containing protein [Frankia sp. AgB1.9]MBL7620417.1 DUF2993 domain-containing protein [Frankia sp. AgB1.8]